jgi:hypothetical protein
LPPGRMSYQGFRPAYGMAKYLEEPIGRGNKRLYINLKPH